MTTGTYSDLEVVWAQIVAQLTRRQFLGSTTALGLAALTGCGADDDSGEAAPATKEVFHAFGVSQVPVDVQRLVVIDQAVTLEHVVALGVQPAGAPIEAQPPVQVVARLSSAVTDTGPSMPANIERIAAVQPDLILGWKVFLQDDLEKRLTGIAPTVGTTRDGFGAWKADLRFVADVLNRRARAEELIAEYEARVARLKQTFAPYADRTYAVISVNDNDIRVDGPDQSFPGPIFAELGLRTGPREIGGAELNPISGQLNFSEEHLPALAAVDGLLIWPRYQDGGDADRALESSPLWQALPAVREGRLAKVSQDTWLQGSVISANLVLDDLERLLANLGSSSSAPTGAPSPSVSPSSSGTPTPTASP